MGLPGYYGRPALVAGYARQSAPASVQVVVFVHLLGAVLCLMSAALVGGVASGVLRWPAAMEPEPEVRQAVAERGPAIALALGVVGLVWLVVASGLRRGWRWSRVLVLVVSGMSIAITLYSAYRGEQLDTSWVRRA